MKCHPRCRPNHGNVLPQQPAAILARRQCQLATLTVTHVRILARTAGTASRQRPLASSSILVPVLPVADMGTTMKDRAETSGFGTIQGPIRQGREARQTTLIAGRLPSTDSQVDTKEGTSGLIHAIGKSSIVLMRGVVRVTTSVRRTVGILRVLRRVIAAIHQSTSKTSPSNTSYCTLTIPRRLEGGTGLRAPSGRARGHRGPHLAISTTLPARDALRMARASIVRALLRCVITIGAIGALQRAGTASVAGR